MASPTHITEFIRERKRSKMGTKRKAALRSKGTTRSHAELFGDAKPATKTKSAKK